MQQILGSAPPIPVRHHLPLCLEIFLSIITVHNILKKKSDPYGKGVNRNYPANIPHSPSPLLSTITVRIKPDKCMLGLSLFKEKQHNIQQ